MVRHSSSDLLDANDYAEYEQGLNQVDAPSIRKLKYVEINGYMYKSQLYINVASIFFQIDHVICIGNDYYLLAKKFFDICAFDEFLNSLKLQKSITSNSLIYKISELHNKKTYQGHFIEDNIFIIADTLDLPYKFE